MSLTERVESVAGSLPSEVAKVLGEIAQEVDKHKALLSDVAALGGPTGEAVATAVEEVSQAETPSPVSSAPTVEPTSGENPEGDKPEEKPTQTPLPFVPSAESSSEDTGADKQDKPAEQDKEVGNPEQAVPYEAQPPKE